MYPPEHKVKPKNPYFKVIFYISGFTAVILFVVRFLGVFLQFPGNDFFLYAALILLVLVCIPSYFISRYRNERKLEEPLNPLEDEEVSTTPKDKSGKSSWGINKSPFRERNSGLTWGGGNVHASNAKRGKRRGFLE